MSRFSILLSVKNTLFTFVFLASLIASNKSVAQDCFAVYGPTGVPTGGLTKDLCFPNPGTVLLNAAAPSALAYTWNTGVNTAAIIPVVGGTFTVTVSTLGFPNACIIDFIVSAHPNPVPELGNDTSFCAGSTHVIKAPLGYTSYIWTGGSTDDTLVVNTPGVYFVTVIDANTCVGSDSVTVSQDTIPIPNLGTGSSLCVGDSVIIDAGAGFSNYLWGTGETTQTYATNVTGTYNVTVTDSHSCEGTDQYIFTNFTMPIINLGANDTLCDGGLIGLDAGAGFATYLWSDGTTNQTASFTATTDAWAKITDGNGCKASDTMHLEVNPLPPLNIGVDDSICASQTYFLNAGNPGNSIVSFLWSTTSTNQTISIVADPSLIADINVDYSVTITDTNGCINMDTMNLVTYTLPTPDLGNDTAYCVGDAFLMTIDPGTFISYNWSTGAVSQTINIGAVGATYIVTVTDARGCTNTDNLSVSENALPVPALGLDAFYCQGSNFTKVLNPGFFATYLWTDGTSGQVLGVSSAGTYGVTVTDANGCENNDEIVITENPTPMVDLGADASFCEDDNVGYFLDATTLLPGNTFNFLWSTNQTTGTITATTFGVFSVTVTDQATNCEASSTMEVVAILKAQPDLGDDGVVCQGQLVKLDPQVTIPGYDYTWSTGATTTTINVFETGLYWVRLDAANGTCMGLTDTVYFSPGVLPVIELGPDQYVCEGQKVKLLNSSTPFPGSTYKWQDGSTSFKYTATETGTYDVEVINECGSVVDQVYLEFQDCSNVWYPKSFTPNGDGRNETFFPKSDQEFAEYGFWIYNRWGSVVFKTNQPNVGWDGKINGQDAAVGNYVWRISYVTSFQKFGVRVEKTGDLTLLR